MAWPVPYPWALSASPTGICRPATICFYAEGVHLVCEGSHVLEELAALAAAGTDLIACGTCLNFYGLAPRVRVGREGTMRDIIAAQFTADRVVTL